MACCGEREQGEISAYQKWDYITLSDFRSSSCRTFFSYGWLCFLAILSVAVYGADTFTAINLLAFDRWSSQIDPTIPFSISKWIFAACIMFSWILCGYEWVRAIRAIRSDGVARSYLDPLAATLQSIRMGSTGRGWRRFLVFAELTKSKKGADYVALFAYFQFKGAIRIILAEGPRQAVNAMTLYSVMQANLIPNGTHGGRDNSSFDQFWINVGILADKNNEQAAILLTMLFTLVVWVISALSLGIACVLYLGFLWHYIPRTDSLTTYCERKIDRRLDKIVNAKIKKAIEKQEDKQRREAEIAMLKEDVPVQIMRKPTLPSLEGMEDDCFSLHRTTSQTTSQTSPPPYSSRPPTRNSSAKSNNQGLLRQLTLPTVNEKEIRPAGPVRSFTQSSGMSNDSHHSDRPLLPGAADMGWVSSWETQPSPLPYPHNNIQWLPSRLRSPAMTGNLPAHSGSEIYDTALPSSAVTNLTQSSGAVITTFAQLPSGGMTTKSQGRLDGNRSLLNHQNAISNTSTVPHASVFKRSPSGSRFIEGPMYEMQPTARSLTPNQPAQRRVFQSAEPLPQASLPSQGFPISRSFTLPHGQPQDVAYRSYAYAPYLPSAAIAPQRPSQPLTNNIQDPLTGNAVPILQNPRNPRRMVENGSTLTTRLPLPRRAVTAPSTVGTYDDSVLDAYMDSRSEGRGRELVARAGTTAPRTGSGRSGYRYDW